MTPSLIYGVAGWAIFAGACGTYLFWKVEDSRWHCHSARRFIDRCLDLPMVKCAIDDIDPLFAMALAAARKSHIHAKC